MIDLRSKDRLAIIAIATDTLPGNASLWAYGSRVNGKSHNASDLDLAVITPENAPLSINSLNDFDMALKESSIPILIDVFDWHRMPTHFHTSIGVSHVELWKGTEAN